MSHTSRTPAANALLANLPAEDSAHLNEFIRIERPPQGRILAGAFDTATDVWFPHAGAIALTTTDASGRSVQTGLVGREGCVGLHALFGERLAIAEAMVQIEGEMSVIAAAHLRGVIELRPRVQAALAEFLCGLSAQSSQTIACNRLHSLLSRCCRWLLMMQDKASSDELLVTQESLATLLGGGRPRVNRLLGLLESKGILRRHRGRIHLLTRRGLEQNSCECYRRVRDAAASLERFSG